MKFFKYEVKTFYLGKYDGRTITETHYLNVDDVRSIIISSENDDYFSLVINGGGLFQINKKYLDSLLKLLDIDEKEAKK